MIKAVIFDKDGTLFDFRASWGAWTRSLLEAFSQTPADQTHLSQVLGYDPARRDFAPDSPVIAMTTREIAEILLPHVAPRDLAEVNAVMERLAGETPMVPAVDLPTVLHGLRAMGLKIGLATNDTEGPARTHLASAGVLELFDFVAGCDSGWGGKPAPGQLLAFSQTCAIEPLHIAMVGDSLHDLDAGRAAGMAAVAVLTGIADAQALSPHADVVLNDISELAAWIETRS